MAVRFDISADADFFIGTDQPIEIDVTQSDESTPQTMTGWALTWELKDSPSSSAHISKTVGVGISIGNGSGTDDRVTITVTDTDTEPLEAGLYYHQLRRTDAGSERILSFGTVALMESGL